ncbi:hypothetical protein [Streptomyces sp. NRRL F-5123]|uniref:hypothetical protein n=1 Tax=Streptomyces sp. NRRL F-5123 TaxID=1463856 RepID=UPI0004E28843|nr:hypothetical protein [Streptomyces sp. NRRL F-5123]
MTKKMSVVRRAAVVAGAMAGAGALVLGTSGVASAETARYTVWSGNCHATMMTENNSLTGWQVRNLVDNYGSVDCSGWMDWAPEGNTSHFYGLQNRIWVGPGRSLESGYVPDNSPALTRVCIQANNDGTARCSSWW